jgi:molybdopterin synthase sulfur carrier subunit
LWTSPFITEIDYGTKEGAERSLMPAIIDIKLFATLDKFMPASANRYPIEPGTSLSVLLDQLGIPKDQAKIIFINGKKAGPDTVLNGGERVGIFPPVGGG